MSEGSRADLVIVGAGAAGLGAARMARELGLDVIVLEAIDRIGGRAFTDPAPFGVPWDRGCHWLHSASINPFTSLADNYGFRYRTAPTPRRYYVDDHWATADEAAAAAAYVDACYESIFAAGRDRRDVPVSSVIDRTDRSFPVLQLGIHAEWGMGVDDVSCSDSAAYRDTDENWPVEDGYGALVAHHAAGIPVELNTPVERIDWGGPRVRVLTGQGTIDAAAVIVTVSTDVLAAEVIAFSPSLPIAKQEAVAAVPLGDANKVGLQIDGKWLGVDGHTNITAPLGNGQLMSFQLRPFGWDLASGYLAGPLCGELEQDGEAAMIDATIEALCAVLGSDIARHIGATACSTWGRERCIGGGYAAAQPGHVDRRADLGTPLDDRLFFAGGSDFARVLLDLPRRAPDGYRRCPSRRRGHCEAPREVTLMPRAAWRAKTRQSPRRQSVF